MCMVVAIHTTHGFISKESLSDLSFCIYNLGVISIPLFFMVSGHLLLGNKKDGLKYSLKKIFAVLRFTFIVAALFWITNPITKYFPLATFSFKILIIEYAYCFIQGGYFWFFWYFGAICIVYLLFPLLNRLYERPSWFFAFLILCILAQNIAFTSNLLGVGEKGIIQTFRLWNWLAYFSLGGMIKKIKVERNIILILFLVLLASVLPYMIWLYPYMGTSNCEFFYSSLLVTILCFTLFLFIHSFQIKKSNIIKNLSNLFLPVYVFHIVFMKLTKSIGTALQGNQFGGMVYWLMILGMTIGFNWLLMKIPLMKKIFHL